MKYVKKCLDANKSALNIGKEKLCIISLCSEKDYGTNCLNVRTQKKSPEVIMPSFSVFPLDDTLSWKFHLIELSRKLSRSVDIFYKLRHFVPEEMLKIVYDSHFLSFSVLWFVVWGATHEKYLKPVFISQKEQ